MAAHVARDRDLKRDRPVREFIAEFRGLSGTAKQRQLLAEVGCSHVHLSQFFGVKQVNRKGIAKLLASMKKHTQPVAPKLLGVIGEDHLKQRFEAAGGNLKTFKYQRRTGVTDKGIPYVVECAFGLHQSGRSNNGRPMGARLSPESTGASESTTHSAHLDAREKVSKALWPTSERTRRSR